MSPDFIMAGDVEHFSAEYLVEFLSYYKDQEIAVLISDSFGGSYSAGMSMYGALKLHKESVTTKVCGLAASVSSIIFLAGDKDKRFMAEGSFMMIHNPGSGMRGNADELRQEADHLDRLKENALDIYEKNSNLPREQLAEMMEAETYISAKEAVEMGFASAVIDGTVEMKAKDLESYKEIYMKKSIKPKQTEKEPTMSKTGLDEKEQSFLSGLFKKIMPTMKGVEKNETEEKEIVPLTEESVAKMIDEKLKAGTEEIMTTMKAMNETLAKIVPPSEEQETEETEEQETEETEEPKMKAEDILEVVEELEKEKVTPAARKEAVRLMKAGEFNKEEFMKKADRVKPQVDIAKGKEVDVDHLGIFRSMKGGEKSSYYRKNMKEIDAQMAAEKN
jgi:ATP-dependent Clp protease protease subunit